MTPSIEQCLAIWNKLHIPALLNDLYDNLPGHPRAQAFDTDRTTSGQGPADPTANAATTPNRAADHLKRLHTALAAIIAIQDQWLPIHEPRRGDIRNETRGCELHRRAGIETHQPAYRNTDLASSLHKALTEPLPLCRACIDFAINHQRTPTNEELRRHDSTGKWKLRTRGKAA